MAVLEDLKQAIISGNRDRATELTKRALEMPREQMVVEQIAAAMEVVGEKFRINEFFVPELLIAQRAMRESLKLLADADVQHIGTVVIGTVKGDLHDIGKNLVAAMLEGAGFKVVDLKVDVAPEQFVKAAQDNGADIIAMSALLTTTMGSMRDTVNALQKAGIRAQVRVLIGGAPVTQSYADEIGSDGYAPDAATAVDKAKELVAGLPKKPAVARVAVPAAAPAPKVARRAPAKKTVAKPKKAVKAARPAKKAAPKAPARKAAAKPARRPARASARGR